MNKDNELLATAKITTKGQITIPKIIRNTLELEEGDSVLFYIDKKNNVKIVNRKDCIVQPDKNVERVVVKGGNNNELLDTAKLTSKGQITIPKQIRDLLNLEQGDSVVFYVDENKNIKIANKKDCTVLPDENSKQVVVKRGNR